MELYSKYKKTPMMKSLHVYERLKEELLGGQWSFGEKILVNELIDKFKVSRRPVMDAMKMLKNDGFVDIIPQSGCKVIDYSKTDVIAQLQLSSALESLCAGLAAANHKSDEIELLEEYQANVKKNINKLMEKQYYFIYNREIHFHISYMTNSERIRNHTMQMWDLNDFYLINTFERSKFDVLESVDFHDQIIHAIRMRDEESAKHLMTQHFNNYINKLNEELP